MPTITFNLNGNPVSVDADNDEELLWVLRDRMDVKGLKYGCGMGLCGACTSHINGKAFNPCAVPVSEIEPPRALPWPQMDLLSECTTRPAPAVFGWNSAGVVSVLSTT